MGDGEKQNERKTLLEALLSNPTPVNSVAITSKVERKLAKGATYAEVLILELQSIIDQRKMWSVVLLGLVSLIIICDMLIIFFTGFGLMKFPPDGTLPLFISSNLAQIFVLSVIVVKFLFKANIVRDKGQELSK